MTTQLHPIMAASLRPFAPPQSEVHKIVDNGIGTEAVKRARAVIAKAEGAAP